MLVGVITSLIAFLAYGGLLITVSQKGMEKNLSGRIFSVYLLDMLLLQAAYFGLSLAQNEQQAILWYTLNIPLSSAQVIIYFFFIRTFLGHKQPRKLVLFSIFIWAVVIVASIIFHAEVFTNIYRDSATDLFLPEIGAVASILSIPTLAFLGATVIDLARNYRGKSRLQQTRIQYLFLAIMIVWLGMSANIVPTLRPYAIDVIANILSAFMIAYAILRYQLLEISIALRKALEAFISILVVGIGSLIVLYFFTYVVGSGAETHLLSMTAIFTVITLLVLIPLRDRIQQFIGRNLFKTTYDSYLMVQRLSRTATSILDLEKLSNMVLSDVINTLHASWGILVLKQDDGNFHPVARQGSNEKHLTGFIPDHPILIWLTKPETETTTYSLKEALEQNILSKEQLGDLNLAGNEFFIPMKTRDQLIGILCLGAKRANQPYSKTDETTLLTIANNIASTIDNARLYEAIQIELNERKRAEDALRENEAIFSSFLEHSQVYVFFKDNEIRSLRLSKNYEQMLGMPLEDLLGKTMDDLFPSDLAKSMVADDMRILNEGEQVHVVEEFNGRTYETTKFPIYKDGKPEMLAGITLDITKRKQAEEKLKEANKLLEEQLGEIKKLQDDLREQAIRDPLTGLHNRRYLYETMEREFARAKRENYPFSVMMVDIDHFKDFNDSYGHQTGDEVIKTLGRLLQGSIRQGDIICRYGGDEFIIILPGMNIKEAGKRAEKIRHAVENLNIYYGGVELTAAVSIGVAVFPQHGDDMSGIINASDFALYEAKQAGRNRVHIWKSKESGPG